MKFQAKKVFSISLVVLVGALCVYCGKKDAPVNENELRMPEMALLQVSDAGKLSGPKQALLQQVRNAETLDFNQLTDLVLEEQAANYRARKGNHYSASEASAQIVSVMHGAAVVPHHKENYEKQLESRSKKALKYNVQSISLIDLITESRLQCYSGTMFHQVAARKSVSGLEFSRKNMVAIYEDGHILSGYVDTKEPRTLYGIETTASGESIINYGLVADVGRSVRVVDADRFALVEIFKFDLANGVEVANAALKFTAEKYGIKDPFYVAAGSVVIPTDRATKLNWSPLAFGTSAVAPGDQEREEIKSIRRIEVNLRGGKAITGGGYWHLHPTPPGYFPYPGPSTYPTMPREVDFGRAGKLPDSIKAVKKMGIAVHLKEDLIIYIVKYGPETKIEADRTKELLGKTSVMKRGEVYTIELGEGEYDVYVAPDSDKLTEPRKIGFMRGASAVLKADGPLVEMHGVYSRYE